MMEFLENIVEYYDELYPVSGEQKSFFTNFLKQYDMPVKILRIGCACGSFEHVLARKGFNVTGIDSSRSFIDTAVRRRRSPSADVRFFRMAPLEMSRFLAKGFYNLIYVLEGFLYLIGDKTLLRKFFHDCRSLLAPGGSLLLHLPGLPQVKESIRIKLVSTLEKDPEKDILLLSQHLEREETKHIPVRSGVPVYIPSAKETEDFAREAGFTLFDYYSGWAGESCPADQAVLQVLR